MGSDPNALGVANGGARLRRRRERSQVALAWSRPSCFLSGGVGAITRAMCAGTAMAVVAGAPDQTLGIHMRTTLLAAAAALGLAGHAAAQDVSLPELITVVMAGDPVDLTTDQRYALAGLAKGLSDSCNFALSDTQRGNVEQFTNALDMPRIPRSKTALTRRGVFQSGVAFADGRDCSDPTTKQLSASLADFMGVVPAS